MKLDYQYLLDGNFGVIGGLDDIAFVELHAGQRRIAPAFVQDARGNVLRPQPLPSAFIALSLGVRRYPLGILLQQPFGLKCA